MKIKIEVVVDGASPVVTARPEPGLVPEGSVGVDVEFELCENGNGVGRGAVGETGLDDSGPDVAPGEVREAGRGVVVGDEGEDKAEGAWESVLAGNGEEEGVEGRVDGDEDRGRGQGRGGEDVEEERGGG